MREWTHVFQYFGYHHFEYTHNTCTCCVFICNAFKGLPTAYLQRILDLTINTIQLYVKQQILFYSNVTREGGLLKSSIFYIIVLLTLLTSTHWTQHWPPDSVPLRRLLLLESIATSRLSVTPAAIYIRI